MEAVQSLSRSVKTSEANFTTLNATNCQKSANFKGSSPCKMKFDSGGPDTLKYATSMANKAFHTAQVLWMLFSIADSNVACSSSVVNWTATILHGTLVFCTPEWTTDWLLEACAASLCALKCA